MQSVPQKKHQSSWISYMMTQASEAGESQVDARTVFYDLLTVCAAVRRNSLAPSSTVYGKNRGSKLDYIQLLQQWQMV